MVLQLSQSGMLPKAFRTPTAQGRLSEGALTAHHTLGGDRGWSRYPYLGCSFNHLKLTLVNLNVPEETVEQL